MWKRNCSSENFNGAKREWLVNYGNQIGMIHWAREKFSDSQMAVLIITLLAFFCNYLLELIGYLLVNWKVNEMSSFSSKFGARRGSVTD